MSSNSFVIKDAIAHLVDPDKPELDASIAEQAKVESEAILGHCERQQQDTTKLDGLTSQLAKMMLSKDMVDVVIVGGGACGLAVVIQLIERIKHKQGKKISSITLVEKKERVGPGLAYSVYLNYLHSYFISSPSMLYLIADFLFLQHACAGSIVNMHSYTMGLYPRNPMHFTEWVQECAPELQNIEFPKRTEYGKYLEELLDGVVDDSNKLGVTFEILNEEVIDVQRTEAGIKVLLKNGSDIQAWEVVLALGNLCASIHKELQDTPGYFRCPWPAEKLKSINSEASVSVLGSRLTAVDVANFLVENGHSGLINFISRSGRLPKVQGPSATFHRTWVYITS